MPFRESIQRLVEKMKTCEEWLELRRDLREPIPDRTLPDALQMRWAEKDDLFAINALQGFVKETDFMEAALRRGDRCLLLESENRIQAFAWVTFTDVRLATWYTLRLAPGESYLVYIFVHPAFAGRGIGSTLLAALMAAVRDGGGIHMISGMYSNWRVSLGMHTKMGFRVHRRLTQCRLMGIFPTPPKVA
ncbi:GCN5-related N-acetyltransferase [Desulfosarcina cetonica]|uniref:GNAT family N-acetyltransferase n=1 Tax=Desulfosarcina cetonica TaxID=90730 RepID=UPI0006D20007|nr:GNAT family N-acetyltransferase [Desulfosarcina cetonica]VTR70566.1 GCN5-related N-acetyltransferase [Desulfosarcina cetonica]